MDGATTEDEPAPAPAPAPAAGADFPAEAPADAIPMDEPAGFEIPAAADTGFEIPAVDETGMGAMDAPIMEPVVDEGTHRPPYACYLHPSSSSFSLTTTLRYPHKH